MIRTTTKLFFTAALALGLFAACGGIESEDDAQQQQQQIAESESAVYSTGTTTPPPAPPQDLSKCFKKVCICDPTAPGGDKKEIFCKDDPHMVSCPAEYCMPCSDYCNTPPPGGNNGGLGPTR
jgi:hypothetical protein